MDLENLSNRIQIIQNKFKVGKFDEVIRDTKLLLKKHNDQQILYNILSLTYQAKGENAKAIDLLTKAIKKSPTNIFFLNNIGISYYNLKNYSEAEYYFKRALDIEPKHINALNNLANLKNDLNLIDEAKELYKKSIELNDNLLEPHHNLASLFQSTGELEKAVYHYEKVLGINPKFTKADRGISMMTKYSSTNKHFLEMKKKLVEANLNDFEKIDLHFALGKAYDDIKDYKNSFSNIEIANLLKKKITKYNINNDINLFNSIKNFFSKDQLVKFPSNKKKIIFILGMPRSGTSLTEQIISSHRNVYGGGELYYFTKFFFEKLKRENQFLMNEKLAQDFNNELIKFQKEYLDNISSIDNSEKVFTDKAPLNFRWIGFIITLFPNSKIIHCKRNSVENCWSIYKNNFDGNIDFSNNLTDLGSFYNLYTDLMSYWNEKFKDKIYNLKYENLVNNPEIETKSLIDFCGLDWDPKCLEFYKNKKTIKTVSFAQARKPIYRSSINISDKYSIYLDKLKSILKD